MPSTGYHLCGLSNLTSYISDCEHGCFIIFCLLLGIPDRLQGVVRKIRGVVSLGEREGGTPAQT